MTLDAVPVRPTLPRVAVEPDEARPRLPDGPSTLGAVESLLRERLHELGDAWRLESDHDDPVLGVVDLPELLTQLVLSGGKRLRPLLVQCGWACVPQAAPTTHAQVVVVGAALELLHAFGLAQDDVMDRSTTRRGQPAVHVRAAGLHRRSGAHDDADRYGDSTAVLVGDLAHAEACDLVAGLPRAVQRRWRDLTRELVRGQARDLSQAARPGAGSALERAWDVARAKTGAYSVQRPLELGAAVAGADAGVLDRLGRAGRLLGEAFALRDDLLGVWGDPSVTGKPVGDDLRDGKATVLLAMAEERLGDADRAAVARLRHHRHDEDDVQRVAAAMDSSGLRDEAESMVAERREQAEVLLRGPGLAPEGVRDLLALADRLVRRTA